MALAGLSPVTGTFAEGYADFVEVCIRAAMW